MTKPFLSVVIPTLNEEKLLPRLLKTLALQMYRDFEVIVVDGKSKDETVKRARKFEKKLPSLKILLSNKKNVGWQRNLGAAKALGEYLVFFDADVEVPEIFLEMVAANLKENKIKLMTTWVKTENCKSHGKFIEVLVNAVTEASVAINKPFAGGYNLIVKKSIFEKLKGFDETVLHGEDYDFTMRCHAHGIKLTVLKYPRLIYSTRRFDKYGLMDVIKKDAKSGIGTLTGRPLKKLNFDYKMGGEIYTD